MRKASLVLSVALVLLALALPAAADPPRLQDLQLSPGATHVDLGAIRITNIRPLMDFLDQHPSLKTVDMYESPVYLSQVNALAERYPGIRFGWTLRLVEDHLVRTDARVFSIRHNTNSPPHRSQDFQLLRYCRELRALDLGHNVITDLSFLSELKELRVLLLHSNQITDISPLSGLPHLEYLELFDNFIEDWTPLKHLHRLLDLNICFNRGPDLSPLAHLTRLERLWLYNSNSRNQQDPVDRELVKELRIALPRCRIDDKSYSTHGGWRTHHRYYVVYNMLHGVMDYLSWDSVGLVPRF